MIAAQADGTDYDVILFLSLLTPVAILGIPYDQQTEEEKYQALFTGTSAWCVDASQSGTTAEL